MGIPVRCASPETEGRNEMSAPPVPLSRADARRNRALVLAAAQRAFAEQGTSVSLAEVARRAGVGAGTVYRHFPTKTELLEAVVHQRVDRLATFAAARLGAPDPGAAFFAVCTEVVVTAPRNKALCELVESDDGWPKALLRSAGARFVQALGELLAAAQRQGAVRADLTVPDVLDLFTGCVAIQANRPAGTGMARAGVLVLDAMRVHPAVTKLGDDPNSRNETPPRNESPGGVPCPICGSQPRRIGTGRPARYCSPACRQKAHRQRTAGRALPRPPRT